MGDEAAQPASILVIGIGNPDRGDDAAGLIVARQIRNEAPNVDRVLEHTGDGTGLIELWERATLTIVIDVMCSGAVPGTIERFDATLHSVPAAVFHNSTHTFGLHEAIELSRALQRLPRQLVVYGIEGRDFAMGADPSPAVKSAMGQVVLRVLQEC